MYENHFKDSGNNYSHSFILAESLDGMGKQYLPREDKDWELLLTKLNQLIDEFHSSTMGNCRKQKRYKTYSKIFFYVDVKEPQKYLNRIALTFEIYLIDCIKMFTYFIGMLMLKLFYFD